MGGRSRWSSSVSSRQSDAEEVRSGQRILGVHRLDVAAQADRPGPMSARFRLPAGALHEQNPGLIGAWASGRLAAQGAIGDPLLPIAGVVSAMARGSNRPLAKARCRKGLASAGVSGVKPCGQSPRKNAERSTTKTSLMRAQRSGAGAAFWRLVGLRRRRLLAEQGAQAGRPR